MSEDTEDLQLDEALKKIEYTFKLTGMNLESSKKTPSQNFRYKFFYIFNFVWLNTDLSGALWFFIDSTRKGASFTSLTYAAPCLTLSFMANTKSMYILINGHYINQILALLRNLERVYKNREKNLEKEELIQKETKFLYFVLKALNFFNWTLTVAFPLMTLTLIGLEYHETGNIVLQLPFRVLYPFDAYDIKYWPWCYIRQVWGTVIVIMEMSGVDYLLFVCISFICIQFKLLQYDITNLIPNVDKFTKNFKDDREFKDKFVELVLRHQEVMRAVDILELLYSKSMLINIVASSLLICLCGFDMLTVDDKPYVISFASFLFASLLQIFTLCYFGDLLMRSSMEVSDAMYYGKWYAASTSVCKELTTIHMRAQKPCKLTAYGYADVNLKAFMKILSTSWSYFALLRTVYSSPRA